MLAAAISWRIADPRLFVQRIRSEDAAASRLIDLSIASLGASTFAAGLRVNTPSSTVVTTAWEHQWRSNATRLDRVTLSIVQFFP